jgi:hypothetical protein
MMNPIHTNRENILAFSEKCYTDSNPFILEMHFRYMTSLQLCGLLASIEEQKTYSPDTIHSRLVAECMLMYYYNRYTKTYGYITWEDAYGNAMSEPEDDFQQKRDYWKRIANDTSPYADYEDEEQLVELRAMHDGRPRLFSRDVSNHN